MTSVRRVASALSRICWIRLSPYPRWTLAMWILLAVASVGSMISLASRFPELSMDYWMVRSWLDEWRFGHGNPYAVPHMEMDYPPWALLLLAPFGWLPIGSATRDLVLINTVIAIAASWQLSGWACELAGAPRRVHWCVAMTAMLLSTRQMRTLLLWGQTLPFALLCFVVAMRQARRRPILAGVCLALASFKLNLAVGFVLALALDRRWRVLVVAAVITVAMHVVAAVSMGLGPLSVIPEFAGRLMAVYAVEGLPVGRTCVPALIGLMIADQTWQLVAYVLFVVGSAWGLLVLARRSSGGPTTLHLYAPVLWSLLVTPNQPYNVILVLPVVWWCGWPEVQLVRNVVAQRVLMTAAVLLFVATVPESLEPWVAPWRAAMGVTVGDWLDLLWAERGRITALAGFGLIVASLFRQARAGATSGVPSATAPAP